MLRNLWIALAFVAISWPTFASADVITDWNDVMRNAMKSDGVHEVNHSNPGWATRSFAMVNAAIYDAFQSVNRTHAPFLYKPQTEGASLEAAVHQAARDILVECYNHVDEATMVQAAYDEKMSHIFDGPAKTAGMALGSAIAHEYKTWRNDDGLKEGSNYEPQDGPGKWRSDPWNPGQTAWGPQWGTVSTYAIGATQPYVDALPPLPSLDSPEYAAAYNEVLNYGALDVYGPDDTPTSRTQDQTEVGLFWAYDRKTMGPPPVLFNRTLAEIATAIGNSPEDNARLFAMASIAQADGAVAAWDAKFTHNFWRPVAGIIEGDTDGNDATAPDTDWRPLGAPGIDSNHFTDDFTPPFPAWVSGHATMGAALYKSIELFYGTNEFAVADALHGVDPATSDYMLTSEEEGGGEMRTFETFSHDGEFTLSNYAGSPDGENTASRIFLGVHWIMDQRDGMTLGHQIALDVNTGNFFAVPEPNAMVLGLFALLLGAANCRSR